MSATRTTNRTRRIAALAVVVPLVGTALSLAAVPATGAEGKVEGLGNNDFLFVNAAEFGTTSLAKVSVAQTAAGVGRNLDTTSALGEKLLALDTNNRNAYGHGAGVSLGLGQGSNQVPQAQLTVAEVTSPPPDQDETALVDLSDTPLGPIVSAVVQPNTAVANTQSVNDFCVVGAPLSGGTASAAELSVLNVELPGDSGPQLFSLLRANQAVHTRSTESLVPNGLPNRFGLATESVIQPVGLSLFNNTPAEVTIRILNPLVLRATAGGRSGSATVAYGADGDGSIPVLSITAGGNTETLTMDQLVGQDGVTLNLGVADIEIGKAPTVSTRANGTRATGSADLIRIAIPGTEPPGANIGGPLGSILNPLLQPVVDAIDPILSTIQDLLEGLGLQVADLRVGHQEVAAEVPVNGINCPIPVTKTANPNPVQVGDTFVYTITAFNTVCVTGLRNVRVEDEISADPGIEWEVVDTRPNAETVTDTRVVWEDIGTIPYGESKSVRISVAVDADSVAGLFHDEANVRGDCGIGSATGDNDTVTLSGEVDIDAPRVTRSRPSLPETGGLPGTGLGVALLGAAAVAGAAAFAVRRRAV